MILFSGKPRQAVKGRRSWGGRTRLRNLQRRAAAAHLVRTKTTSSSQKRGEKMGGRLTLELTFLMRTNLAPGVTALAEIQLDIRGDFKYYFADFVRKGGTPPPLRIFFRQKKSYGFGGYPPPPLYGLFPEKFSSKRARNGASCSKIT